MTTKTKTEARLKSFKKLLRKKLLLKRRQKLFVWLQKVDYKLYLKQMPKDKDLQTKYKALYDELWKKYKSLSKTLTVRAFLKKRSRPKCKKPVPKRSITSKKEADGAKKSPRSSKGSVGEPDITEKKKTINRKSTLHKRDSGGKEVFADGKRDSVTSTVSLPKRKSTVKKKIVKKRNKRGKLRKWKFSDRPSCPIRKGGRYVTVYGNSAKYLPLEIRLPEALLKSQQIKKVIESDF